MKIAVDIPDKTERGEAMIAALEIAGGASDADLRRLASFAAALAWAVRSVAAGRHEKPARKVARRA